MPALGWGLGEGSTRVPSSFLRTGGTEAIGATEGQRGHNSSQSDPSQRLPGTDALFFVCQVLGPQFLGPQLPPG